jgi:sugar (pentulose or hexulose) kinase
LIGGGLPREALYRLGEQLAADRFGPPTMMFVGPTVFNLLKMNPHRPGGILFPFPSGLMRPDRGALVRAFLESVGYALRANLEQMARLTGSPVSQLTVSGGMSRSSVLTHVIADIVGVPVRVAEEPESAALGCAVLIAANGTKDGLRAAVRTMVRHARVEPDAGQHEKYEPSFARWRDLYNHLENTSLT